MQIAKVVTRAALLATVAGAVALSGCQSFKDAVGASKAPPDEFTVVTAGPLILPPDYNLRPPQPGAPSRTIPDPSSQARAALYTTTPDPAALGTGFSDGEKMLLARTGALNVDPTIRQTVSQETRYEVGDPQLTDRVLSGQTVGSAPAPQTQPAPAPAQEAPAAQPPSQPATQPAAGQ